MPEYALRLQHLGKKYRLRANEPVYLTLRETLSQLPRQLWNVMRGHQDPTLPQDVWILQDVTLDVLQGQILGIVGHNGAGKSTLLKLLSKITSPTTGLAEIFGRVGALLEVGTGFHAELTGRENIFFSGAILGMSQQEIRHNFDRIVTFADVGTFLDIPVKRYSSGMSVRLAFAIAAYLETDILIVDEVLAVGDAEFQKKCLTRMKEVAAEGRTVLFVSHHMESMLALCDRVLWLERGRIRMEGPAKQVIQQYLSHTNRASQVFDLMAREDRLGSGVARFTHVHFFNERGEEVSSGVCGESLRLRLSYRSNEVLLKYPLVWAWVRDQLGRDMTLLFNMASGDSFETIPGHGAFECYIPRLHLSPGLYSVHLTLKLSSEDSDHVEHAASFEVLPGDYFGTGFPVTNAGAVLTDQQWHIVE